MDDVKVRQALNMLANAVFFFMLAVIFFVAAVHSKDDPSLEWMGCAFLSALTLKDLAGAKSAIDNKGKGLEEPF